MSNSNSDADDESDHSSPSPVRAHSPAHAHRTSRSVSPVGSTLSLRLLPTVLARNPSFTNEYGPLRMSLTAFALGLVLMTGVLLAVVRPASLPWSVGAFVSVWSLFHWMEYLMTGLFHPNNLSFNSFLLNHSRAFHLALAASILELILELALVPYYKRQLLSLSWLWLILVLFFQCFRSLSMYQAGANFTHLVAHHHQPQHQLVTTGLYGLVRHPSYCAWYYWSIATQLLLGNPLCAVGYSVVAWKFFAQRIEYEEERMIAFFGQNYCDYQGSVSTGIPFLRTQREKAAKQ